MHVNIFHENWCTFTMVSNKSILLWIQLLSFKQNNLLVQLLSVPKLEEDEQLHLLAGKIVLYYASDENVCSLLFSLFPIIILSNV